MSDGSPWRLVTVDIDGTLTRVHGWKEIAKAFGQLNAFEETNRQFHAREIGEDAHLANLLNIATGHTVSEVEAVLARTPTLVGISDGIARLHEHGSVVSLLTHNPDYVAGWYRRTFGFDDAEGVTAQAVDEGRIGPPIRVRADKPSGLRALLSRYAVAASAAVHIEDGLSDLEIFRLVGGGVALNSPYPEVRRSADLALSADDFRVVVDRLARMTPRK